MKRDRDWGRRTKLRASPFFILVVWFGTVAIWLASCGRRVEAPSPASGHPLDELVLASIGDREIKVRDLHFKVKVQLPAMLGAEGMTDLKQKRQVLQQTLNQYAWVYLAEKNGWDRDPEFTSVVELSRKYILSNHATQKAVYDHLVFDEEELRAYFVENPDQFLAPARLQASVILCESEREAQEVARRARAGEDFAALAQAHSRHVVSQALGGRLGTIGYGTDVKGFSDPTLADRIMELANEEISEPLKTAEGWGVFYTYDRVEVRPREFEEVREVIHQRLSDRRSNDLFAEVLEGSRQEAHARIDENAWIEYSATLISDQATLSLATSEKDAERKVALYRALAKNHPDSPLAPQAHFMIGFVLADELRDFSAARPAFEQMIAAYPGDELVPSARWMLEHMEEGLDGQDQLQQIKKKVAAGAKGAP